MSFSTSLPATALKLITKFGTTCVLTCMTGSVYDTATSTNVVTTADQTIKGIVEEYSDTIRALGSKLSDGTLIETGDKKLYIAGKGLINVPKVADQIVVGGVGYSIVNVASVYAGNNIALYALNIRRGLYHNG